jgi:hypothetical protein
MLNYALIICINRTFSICKWQERVIQQSVFNIAPHEAGHELAHVMRLAIGIRTLPTNFDNQQDVGQAHIGQHVFLLGLKYSGHAQRLGYIMNAEFANRRLNVSVDEFIQMGAKTFEQTVSVYARLQIMTNLQLSVLLFCPQKVVSQGEPDIVYFDFEDTKYHWLSPGRKVRCAFVFF